MAETAPRTPADWVVRADDASVDVVVHGMLNSITVIRAAARLLDAYWDRLSELQRAQMLDDIVRHVELVGGVLTDVSSGLGSGSAAREEVRPERVRGRG